jgi:hypothetical protein
VPNNIFDAEDPEIFKVIKINNEKIEYGLLQINSNEGHGCFNPDPGELIPIKEDSKV